jgi:hypothetical protein
MIEFKQGLDPYKTMEIGANRPIEIKDQFKCIQTISWNNTNNVYGWYKAIYKSGDTSLYYKDRIYVLVDIAKNTLLPYSLKKQPNAWNFSLDDINKYFIRV